MTRAGPERESAAEFVPDTHSLKVLREAANGCHGCPLWRTATQVVFGEGKSSSRLFFVGEQPGNDEDLKGHPFVGPAGRLLDQALQSAGIARSDAYVTNAVKHFKWVQKGSRRLHKKPSAREVGACIPWLEAEIDLIAPKVVICLGATAAQAVVGPGVRVTVDRGKSLASRFERPTIVTVHPSSLLRLPPEADREAEIRHFVRDLKVAAKLAA
jgi:DNA polymerase